MSTFTILLVALVVQLATGARATDTSTVPQLNLTQYVGRWYQVYGDYNSLSLFQRDCQCVTADYGLLPNKSVSVQNSCRLKSPDGVARIINGFAIRPDDNEQGKLKVALGGAPRPAGNYWVIQLGPPTYKGYFYQFAVVTDTCGLSLFVLARNVTEFKQSYELEVLTQLKRRGFTKFFNKPRETYQGTDCMYV